VAKTNTIEINGQRYDAVSGQALDVSPKPKHPQSRQQSHLSPENNKIHSKGTVPRKSRLSIKPPKPTGHRPQPTKTLMRHSLSKPSALTKTGLKIRVNSAGLVEQPSILAKFSVQAIDPKRLARAKRIIKSRFISRFGDLKVATPSMTAQGSRTAKTANPLTTDPVLNNPQQPQKEDIFQKALERATSHVQQPPGKKHLSNHHKRKASKGHRLLSVSGSALAILLVTGFIVHQSSISFNLHNASLGAGFNASLPGQTPAGFSSPKLSYRPGLVTVSYVSNSDQRQFVIEEHPSDWNNQTLLSDFVVPLVGQDYQTMEVAGRNVYFYDQSKATWISQGIWYQAQTNGVLSTNQLLEIAASI